MPQTIKKFVVLNDLNEELLKEFKLFYVFKDHINKSNAFIFTKNDKIFAIGINHNGVFGFGNNKEIKNLTVNEELSDEKIVDFKYSSYHVIAHTIDIYCWGRNENGFLGNGREGKNICKPEINKYLRDKQIVDICCDGQHSLAFTNSGEVYA
jgi:alpha-tubulin suppressor-like RCC1 family protein